METYAAMIDNMDQGIGRIIAQLKQDGRLENTLVLYLQDNESAGGFSLGSLGPVSEGLFIWIFGIGSLIAITVWITAKSN